MLLNDHEAVTCSPIFGLTGNKLPLVRLRFSSPRITVNSLWCRYFRAWFQPVEGSNWLTHPVYFQPSFGEIYLAPFDLVDRYAARCWRETYATNPIASAIVGFPWLTPQRSLRFITLH